MVQRALKLEKDGAPLVKASRQTLSGYFNFDGEDLATLEQVFSHIWRDKSVDMAEMSDATVTLSIDEANQNLITPIFLKKVKEWGP